MKNFEDYLFTGTSRYFLWGAFGVVVVALAFHAGVTAGSHRAHGMHGPADFMGFVGFMPNGHGAVGSITTIALPLITLTSREGAIILVDTSSSTTVVGAASSSIDTLSVGQVVIVIGEPKETDVNDKEASGEIDARFIRVLPPPPTTTQ